MSLADELVESTEVFVLVCVNVPGRSPFVLILLNRTSVAEGADRVTVVTAPNPFTDDF
jgi:hypothetical protein